MLSSSCKEIYKEPLSPSSCVFVTTATLLVYIGSHRSLRLLATEDEGGMAAKDGFSTRFAWKKDGQLDVLRSFPNAGQY